MKATLLRIIYLAQVTSSDMVSEIAPSSFLLIQFLPFLLHQFDGFVYEADYSCVNAVRVMLLYKI